MLIEGWRWLLSRRYWLLAGGHADLLHRPGGRPASDGLRAINAIPGFDYETERVTSVCPARLGSMIFQPFSRCRSGKRNHPAQRGRRRRRSADELETRQRRFFRDNLSVQPHRRFHDDPAGAQLQWGVGWRRFAQQLLPLGRNAVRKNWPSGSGAPFVPPSRNESQMQAHPGILPRRHRRSHRAPQGRQYQTGRAARPPGC
ncbi:hypothetical protein DSL92_06295 [Billgrantia gudaonensis]|uniref:Uncharacterized protein n=1 Tax=Billgrantia gudaonensis TaxID=376427 RepID=A0A432JIS5_9GAMM|nr:hypothetical protein DSL92_06295 [Halomonas gudaonensis]